MNVLSCQLKDDDTVAFTLDHAATVIRALSGKGNQNKWQEGRIEMDQVHLCPRVLFCISLQY